MTMSRLSELACTLAAAARRTDEANALARDIGAEAMLVLIHDPEIDALISAPGFRKSLPGGKSWSDLLDRCRQPGVHHGSIHFPDQTRLAPAQALVLEDRCTFVFIGGAPRLGELDISLLCVLSRLFIAEAAAEVAESRARLALESARHAKTLMDAVDVARGQAIAARKESELAARAKDDFLAMLGHELRNPLAPMLSALYLMKVQGPETFKMEREVLDRQLNHMVRLVDDLLDVSRIASGNIELKKEYVELDQVVQAALETVNPNLEQKRQVLTTNIGPVSVVGDSARLAQVFINLLTNASRYTPEQGRIHLTLSQGEGQARFSVKDNGIGIDAELLPRVFDLFFQGKQSLARSSGGLGLGLAIVKNLVRLHGGTVEARSAGPGRGSEFAVCLPGVSQRAPHIEQSRSEKIAIRGAGEKVLVVDDNIDHADMLSAGLRQMGYDTVVAHDATAAISIANRSQFSIGLLDIGLPGMDGYQLARELRRIAGLSDLPLIALTGYGQDGDREVSRKAGINMHLTKPVEPAVLANAIRACIKRKN